MTPRTCAICRRPNPSPQTGKVYRTYAVRSTTGATAWECKTCAHLGTDPQSATTITTTERLPLGRLRDGTLDLQTIVHHYLRKRAVIGLGEDLDRVVARLYDPRRAFSLDPAHYEQPACEKGHLGDLCQRYHEDPYAHNTHVAMLLASAMTPWNPVPCEPKPRKGRPFGETDPLERLPLPDYRQGYQVPHANFVAAEDRANYRRAGGHKARDLSEILRDQRMAAWERAVIEDAEREEALAQDTMLETARLIGALAQRGEPHG